MLEGFTDSDMSADVDSSRSTSAYVMTYVVEARKDVIWMKNFLSELGMKQETFLLYRDNQTHIYLAKNVVYHAQTKHIQRRNQWLQEKVDEEEFTPHEVPH